MSAGGRFGGSRGLQARPPEKGVFPLDHFGECAKVKDDYLKCVADNKGRADQCIDITRAYLTCRMDKNLMAPQDLRELGVEEGPSDASKSASSAPQNPSSREKTRKGFVAGIQ